MNTFSSGLKKIADAPTSPKIDPIKAAQMQAGGTSSGVLSMGQMWGNLKSGLGISPPDAGTIARSR